MGDGSRDRKYAFIDADDGEEGVWTADGLCLPFASDILPISPDLARRIIDWQIKRCPTANDSRAVEDFCALGLRLAKEVKSQLPDWTITYGDWRRFFEAMRLGKDGYQHYEYEVTLSHGDEEACARHRP
jgi:hypothetical protein